jgi:EAL domain-containing protein (putative c-di-GMP-specific phosphodiesterase class I)/ActR/RegA family two-component response regulator
MGELHHREPPRTALVLDDEIQIGAIVCKVLKTIGIATSQFTDPLQFLLEVKRSPPDVLILDLQLGRADAVDVIRKLDVLEFAGNILLISGRDEATLHEIERVGRAHGLRMLKPLRKPFRAIELKARLQTASEPEACEPETPKPAPSNLPAIPGALLGEALEREWLELWYQPKVELKSLSVCGAEALIRARHPERGVIGPAELLPAPGDQLYKPLSLFVIRRAVLDWRMFASLAQPMRLAVNVPASVLSAPGFVDFVRTTLPTHPKFPGLIVEVTEDEVIRDTGWIHEVATQLRLYNVSISIDDFGSAYASLSRIKDLPFREVKLDRSFVANCASDALKRALCSTVVDLAHCVGASACAEGVETVEDMHCLAELGFDTAQGFIFAKPMPSTQFLQFVAQQQGGPLRHIRSAQSEVAAQSVKA